MSTNDRSSWTYHSLLVRSISVAVACAAFFLVKGIRARALSGSGSQPSRQATAVQDEFGTGAVRFPEGFATPKRDVSQMSTPLGPIPMVTYSASSRDGALFFSYFDYPEAVFKSSDRKTILDQACVGAVQNTGSEVSNQTPYTINGQFEGRHLNYSGVERKIQGQLGRTFAGRADLILVNARLYQVGAVGADRNFLESPEVASFFGSFSLQMKSVQSK